MFPRLIKLLWREHIVKEAGFLSNVPVGTPFGRLVEHETMIVASFLPVIKFRYYRVPWTIRGSDFWWKLLEIWRENKRAKGGGLCTFPYDVSCDGFQSRVVGCAGLFCGNFCTRRGQFYLCKMMWCRRCYVKHNGDGFPKAGKIPGGDWD